VERITRLSGALTRWLRGSHRATVCTQETFWKRLYNDWRIGILNAGISTSCKVVLPSVFDGKLTETIFVSVKSLSLPQLFLLWGISSGIRSITREKGSPDEVVLWSSDLQLQVGGQACGSQNANARLVEFKNYEKGHVSTSFLGPLSLPSAIWSTIPRISSAITLRLRRSSTITCTVIACRS
jgi:hypothetical protein